MIAWMSPDIIHRLSGEIGEKALLAPTVQGIKQRREATRYGGISLRKLCSILAPSRAKTELLLKAATHALDINTVLAPWKMSYSLTSGRVWFTITTPFGLVVCEEDMEKAYSPAFPEDIPSTYSSCSYGTVPNPFPGYDDRSLWTFAGSTLFDKLVFAKYPSRLEPLKGRKVGLWKLHGIGVEGIFITIVSETDGHYFFLKGAK